MNPVRTALRRTRRVGGALLAVLALGGAAAALSAPAPAFADGTSSSDGGSCPLGPRCFKPQAAPQVTVAPASVDFRDVPVGTTSKVQAVSVTNTSAHTQVSVTGASATGAFDSRRSAGCDVLQPGSSCSVDVTFTPTRSDPVDGALTIATDVAGSKTVALSGTGTTSHGPNASVTVAPTSLDFGAVRVGQRSSAKSVTVTNTGDGTDAVTTVSLTQPFAADGSGCVSKTLRPGGTCTVLVTFTPAVGGDAAGSLRISTQNGGSGTVTVAGSGAVSQFSVTPHKLAFGAVRVGTRSAAKNVTVRNTGQLDVTVKHVTDPGFTLDAAPCTGRTLSPSRSCEVTVSFEPQTAGAVTDTLIVSTSAGQFTVALSGTGVRGHGVGGVHTGPRPRGARPGLSHSGALSQQALVAGLALLVAGLIMQVAGGRRRRA